MHAPHAPLWLMSLWLLGSCFSSGMATATAAEPVAVQTDLLIVGGSESAVAAAVQAARLGVKSIVLVNDIHWLGGQFTAEAIGAVDEWTIYGKRRAPFARSGQFLEIMTAIEKRMNEKYGLARPGNCFCAWTTCEPRDTETLFREFLAPYLHANQGPVTLYEDYEPAAVAVAEKRVTGVTFHSVLPDRPALQITAKLTIDASDWGDVIRLSGAAYLRGPDLKATFQEPSAPENGAEVEPNEMNPLTYCIVLRESDSPTIIEKPAHYDERRYFGTTNVTRKEYGEMRWPAGTMGPFAAPWVDSTMSNGPYAEAPTVYTHRRLVDRIHNRLAPGSELVLLNWPLQDYPTYNFPSYVVEQLEATEPGAGKKNLVDMTPAQRRIVFHDAKDHALGMLYHLQTTVHEKDPTSPGSFRSFKLTDEFGTPDRLPPKPYVREAARMAALYMLREQDIRDTDGNQSWAKTMVPDSVFGFQFNIDFHPTRRIFWKPDTPEVWAHIHSKLRNWGTHTDRAGFPLRSLVPVEHEGLLGAGKNLGYTSIVSSAVRLHGHGMAVGQASATIAAVAFVLNKSPREIAHDIHAIRRIQLLLVEPPNSFVTGDRPPGLLLWPYQDLPPNDPAFVAANQLAVRMILPGDAGAQDFHAPREVRTAELAQTLMRAVLYSGRLKREAATKVREQITAQAGNNGKPSANEVAWACLQAEGIVASDAQLEPDAVVARGQFGQWLARIAEPVHEVLHTEPDAPLTRGVLAISLWHALHREVQAGESPWFQLGVDSDGDGLADLADPLPRDKNNDSVPDLLEIE